MLFRLQDEETQNKRAAISTWFALSKSLILTLVIRLKRIVGQYFRIKFFDKYLFLRHNSAKADI